MAQATSERTPFSADPTDELPVGAQVSWHLRALIATGRLSGGERLPSVRTLAEWTGVHMNTVRAVYRQLEQEGLITTEERLGTFVAAEAPSSPELERIADAAIAAAEIEGLGARHLALVAYVCARLPATQDSGLPADPPGADPAAEPPAIDRGDERAARRELRRQIGLLEAELASYVRDLPPAQDQHPPRTPEGRVAGIEELEAVRDALVNRLRDAREAAGERASREQLARGRRDAMIADPESHRGEVISSDDTGEPGDLSWEVEPRYGPLGAIMNWWRIKASQGN